MRIATIALAFCVAFGAGGGAQEHAHHPPAVEGRDLAARPVAVAPQLNQAPRIDGRLDAAEWEGATRLSGFIQRDPHEGAPATERTEVLVARDRSTLFVALIAWDSDMSQVRAVHSARDRLTEASDLVGIWIDPLQSGTRAFGFQFNPGGTVRRDLGPPVGHELGWSARIRGLPRGGPLHRRSRHSHRDGCLGGLS